MPGKGTNSTFLQDLGRIANLRIRGRVSQEKGWKFYPLRFKSSLGKALENICWDRKGPRGADGRNWRSCPGFHVCPSSCSRSTFSLWSFCSVTSLMAALEGQVHFQGNLEKTKRDVH